MPRFIRDNGLTLFFLLLFLCSLAGQAVAGFAEFNDQQLVQGGATITFGDYLTSSDFAVDTAENWQSEYLQFLLLIYLTVWLVQRGSPESKPVGKIGPESDAEQRVAAHARPGSPDAARLRGLPGTLFGHSLGLLMGAVFALSWLAQSIAGRAAYNAQRIEQLQDPVGWLAYVTGADFWSRTLQNWQSEFLAVASMAIFAVYLRQRGSPESKPVGESHGATDAGD
ncbi:DUF6766 family protein [Allonocardiopsis opalescens]|uniref:Transmembrane protein n=1 Tax=Allonocardiopsis opalescens TaxID=1144618 RepID=A0A2T0Q7A3_9ACTN|nr:DUF6766 family protein [Allonocardiopsis opalescens]PRX99674.1 hypothetical protein CLV72_103279 [Allonocardiopsis opalescens]